MTQWTLARIRGYYQQHAGVLADQLSGRPVQAFPPDERELRVGSAADVLDLTEAGVGGFLISASSAGSALVDRAVIQLTPGDGTDVATAATVALWLGDQLARDRHTAITLVDGQGGLTLLVRQPPIDAAAARGYLGPLLAAFALSNPELATIDPALADGRVLLSAAATAPDVFHWAPYSLVPGSWPGVVMPIHRDDVAAASAGMPLEIEPEDVADRLTLRGDLLAVTSG